MADTLTSLGIEVTSDQQAILSSAEVTKMLSYYGLPKAWDNVFCWIAEDGLTESEINEEKKSQFYKFLSFLLSSQPYYKIIIDSYKNNIANLMADISSSSTRNGTSTNTTGGNTVTKINELPQTEFVSTDNHLSNLTDETSTGSDNGTNSETVTALDERDTKIARLAEIRDKLDNTYQRWADEFIQKFVIM